MRRHRGTCRKVNNALRKMPALAALREPGRTVLRGAGEARGPAASGVKNELVISHT